MDQDATWYGGRPAPGVHCVRQGPIPRKGHSSPPYTLLAHVYVISQTLPKSTMPPFHAPNHSYLFVRHDYIVSSFCNDLAFAVLSVTNFASVTCSLFIVNFTYEVESLSLILIRGFMAALCNRTGHYIFALWFLLSFSSPNLSGRRLDVYRTSAHGVALVRI